MDKKLILNELKKYKNFTKDSDFARFLGISQQCLKGWYDRNTFDINKLRSIFPEVSTDYLLSGEGVMFKVPCTDKDPMKPTDQIVYGTGQNISGNNNCNNSNGSTDSYVTKELLERLKEKDDQINRLLKIIENKG